MTEFLKKHKKDIILFLIPFLIFLFLLLAYYPGIVPYDGNNQWQQVQSGVISNAHPFFSTYFMYLLSKIWNNIKIVMLFQMFIYSLFWSIICYKTRTENNFKIQVIYSIIVSLIPIIGLYSITVWKDILYTYYLGFLGFIIYDVASKKNFRDISILEYGTIGLLMFLVFSYRHNGMIVAILFMIIFYGLCLFKNKCLIIKKSLITLAVFILCFVCVSIPKNKYLTEYNKLNSKNGETISTIDMYITWIFGIYIQNDMVEKEDLKFLNNIKPIDSWKENYNGYLTNKMFTPDDIDEKFINSNSKKYRDLFIKYVKKYPVMLLKHYSMSDAMLFSINSMDKGYVYVYPFDDWTNYRFNVNSKISWFEKIYTKVNNLTLKNPIKYLYQPGLILYICIILSIVMAKILKDRKVYYLLLPSLLNTLSLMPISVAQDLRYAYINYITLILLVLVFICKPKKKNN